MKHFLTLLFLAGCNPFLMAQKPGDLSSDFGTGGRLLFDADHLDHCTKVLVDQDRVYLCGYTTSLDKPTEQDYVVAAFDHEGQADGSFGLNGMVRSDFPGFPQSRLTDAALHDQQLYLAGTASFGSVDTQAVVVCRLLQSGAVDSSFADSGYFIGNFLGPRNDLGGIEVLENGSILLFGTAFDSNYVHKELPLLGRLNPGGTADNSFAAGGFVTWEPTLGFQEIPAYKARPGRHEAGGGLFDVCVLGDDHYVFCGYFSGSYYLGLNITVNLNASEAFQAQYYPILSNFSGYYASALTVNEQPLVCAAPFSNFSAEDFLLQTLSENGLVDTTLQIDFDYHQDHSLDMCQDAQDRIVTVGYSRDLDNNQAGYESDYFAVAVLEDPVTPNRSFGEHGQVRYDFGFNDECGAHSAAAIEDFIYVAGYVKNSVDSNDLDMGLIKLHNPTRSLAIEQPAQVPDIRLYPNPANDLLHVEFTANSASHIEIHSLDGSLLHSQQILDQHTILRLSAFSPGIYFLRVIGPDFTQSSSFMHH